MTAGQAGPPFDDGWYWDTRWSALTADMGRYTATDWPPPIPATVPADADEIEYIVSPPPSPRGYALTHGYSYRDSVETDGLVGADVTEYGTPGIPDNAHLYVIWFGNGYPSSDATTFQPSVTPQQLVPDTYYEVVGPPFPYGWYWSDYWNALMYDLGSYALADWPAPAPTGIPSDAYGLEYLVAVPPAGFDDWSSVTTAAESWAYTDGNVGTYIWDDTTSVPAGAHLFLIWYPAGYLDTPPESDTPRPSVAPTTLVPSNYLGPGSGGSTGGGSTGGGGGTGGGSTGGGGTPPPPDIVCDPPAPGPTGNASPQQVRATQVGLIVQQQSDGNGLRWMSLPAAFTFWQQASQNTPVVTTVYGARTNNTYPAIGALRFGASNNDAYQRQFLQLARAVYVLDKQAAVGVAPVPQGYADYLQAHPSDTNVSYHYTDVPATRLAYTFNLGQVGPSGSLGANTDSFELNIYRLPHAATYLRNTTGTVTYVDLDEAYVQDNDPALFAAPVGAPLATVTVHPTDSLATTSASVTVDSSWFSSDGFCLLTATTADVENGWSIPAPDNALNRTLMAQLRPTVSGLLQYPPYVLCYTKVVVSEPVTNPFVYDVVAGGDLKRVRFIRQR